MHPSTRQHSHNQGKPPCPLPSVYPYHLKRNSTEQGKNISMASTQSSLNTLCFHPVLLLRPADQQPRHLGAPYGGEPRRGDAQGGNGARDKRGRGPRFSEVHREGERQACWLRLETMLYRFPRSHVRPCYVIYCYMLIKYIFI